MTFMYFFPHIVFLYEGYFVLLVGGENKPAGRFRPDRWPPVCHGQRGVKPLLVRRHHFLHACHLNRPQPRLASLLFFSGPEASCSSRETFHISSKSGRITDAHLEVKFPVCRFLLLQPGGSRECSCWNQSRRGETEEEQLVAAVGSTLTDNSPSGGGGRRVNSLNSVAMTEKLCQAFSSRSSSLRT